MTERTSMILAFPLLSMLWAAPALAQSSELGVGEQRPWARSVSQQEQQAADALFQEGNIQLHGALFVKAAETYRRALQHWDHPAIHYNLALALLTLNRPLEFHASLEGALRYGGEPLDEGKRNRARQLKALVEQQLLTRLELICDVPGSSVKMGEEPLCNAPARFVRWVLPGEVTFTATKEGYPSNLRRRTLRSGETVTLHFKMYTEEELTQHTQRWAAWKPWAMLGAGAAIAASGGLFYAQARANHQDFDTGVRSCIGCELTPELTARRLRGDRLQRVASGAYTAGGAALVTGFALLYANRPKTRVLTPDEHEQDMNLTPVLGKHPGAVLTIRY